MDKNPPIKILDFAIQQKEFPHVYELAKHSPERLTNSIKGMMSKEGERFKVFNALVILESDLA